MNNKNIGEFLKNNHSIFSYIKDNNGNRIGVMLATCGVKERYKDPKIGVAFFPEVIETYGGYGKCPLYTRVNNIYEFPNFMESLRKYAGVNDSLLGNIKLPFSGIYPAFWKFRPECIKKFDTIKLARQRANFDREHFYLDSRFFTNTGEFSDEYFTDLALHYVTDMTNIRHQIRKFEFRALRYFKYIDTKKN